MDEDFEEEVIPIYVSMEVEYRDGNWPGIPHNAVHRFVDYAPHFEISNELIETYGSLEDVYFRIRHTDVPNPIPDMNHLGVVAIQ